MAALKEIRGIHSLRTLSNIKHRSIPRRQRSTDIELFLLKKEKELFEIEAHRLKTKLTQVKKRIKSLEEEIVKNQDVLTPTSYKSTQVTNSLELDSDKPWNIKKLKY